MYRRVRSTAWLGTRSLALCRHTKTTLFRPGKKGRFGGAAFILVPAFKMATPLKEILVTGVRTTTMKYFLHGTVLARQPLLDIAIGKSAPKIKIVLVGYRPVQACVINVFGYFVFGVVGT